MAGYLDLEKYVCEDCLNRPDIEGVIDRTKSSRPWFRSLLPLALRKLQTPHYKDGKLLWDGTWKASGLAGYAVPPTDAQYLANYADWFTTNLFTELGLLVEASIWRAFGEDAESKDTFSLAEIFISDTWRKQQVVSTSYLQTGYLDLETHVCLTLLDRPDLAGVIDATQSPRPWFRSVLPLALKKLQTAYYKDGKMLWDGSWRASGAGTITAPTDAQILANATDWITLHLFDELASLAEAMMLHALKNDEKSKIALANAEESISNAWRLNQLQAAVVSYLGVGYLDLETNVCMTILKRPDLAGVVDGTIEPRPWFRPMLAQALKLIQSPYYSRDGKRELLWDGGWRASGSTVNVPAPTDAQYATNSASWFTTNMFPELSTLVESMLRHALGDEDKAKITMAEAEARISNVWRANQLQAANTSYLQTGYLDLETHVCASVLNRPDLAGVIDSSKPPRPWFRAILPLVLKEIQTPCYGEKGLLWDGSWRASGVSALVTPPTDAQYAANVASWFTTNLFNPFATLIEATIRRSLGDEAGAKSTRDRALQLISDAWRLNQTPAGGASFTMTGYLDLETYICSSLLKRPDLAGVVDATKEPRPWFRSFLPLALKMIQEPYYSARDGKRMELWDGSWRGMEITTEGNDPTYASTDTDGIAYPTGYRSMRYVYLVGSDGTVSKHPIQSVTEQQRNTQDMRRGWRGACEWFGFADWDWWGWDESCQNGRVKWMDNNGKFYLTWTPQNTLTLRMTYIGYATPPTDAQIAANASSWFTANMFLPLAALLHAMMLNALGLGDKSKEAMVSAEQLIGDRWALDRAQKAGSNDKIFIPSHAPSIHATRGW